jgi:hypothetical protein
MKEQGLYHLSTAQITNEIIVETPHGLISDSRSVLLGQEKLSVPVKFTVKMGRKYTDFITSTYTSINLVSERFVNAVTLNKFTGIDFVETEIYAKNGNKIDKKYFIIVVNGRLGRIDWGASVVVDKPPRVPNGRSYKVHKGLFFEQSIFEYRDFSVPIDTGMIIVSSRVADFINHEQMSNVKLCHCEEYESSSIIAH